MGPTEKETKDFCAKAFTQALEEELGIKFDPAKSLVENVHEVDGFTGFFLGGLLEVEANFALILRVAEDYTPQRDWARLCNTYNAQMQKTLQDTMAKGEGTPEEWAEHLRNNWHVTMMGGYRAMNAMDKVTADLANKLYRSEEKRARLTEKLDRANDKIKRLESSLSLKEVPGWNPNVGSERARFNKNHVNRIPMMNEFCKGQVESDS